MSSIEPGKYCNNPLAGFVKPLLNAPMVKGLFAFDSASAVAAAWVFTKTPLEYTVNNAPSFATTK